ncbi:hypothetical protein SUGI_0395700 [Cryptomeria japonica]|nr:hypothetical protein SUGI_0395700 [Cryptomeria japonica]
MSITLTSTGTSSMRRAFAIQPPRISSPNLLPSSTRKHTGLRLIANASAVSSEFRITELPPVAKEEFYAASVLDIEEVAPGIRCVAVEAEISRELVHREDAYRRAGQLARVRVGERELKVPVCSAPFSRDCNWSVVYKARGDMPSGAMKAPNSTLSVKAPLQLHVTQQHLPDLFALSPGDELQLGPFDEASGLDLRPLLFISGFPTVLIFASGRGIAVSKAIIEANEGDNGSINLGFREEVRLYYSAPDPALIAYKGKFEEWEKRKVKTRTTVLSRGEQEWDGFVGSFTHLWDEDDIEYNPETTAAIVCVEEDARDELKELLSGAEIPDKQVLYWNAAL